MTLPKQLDAAAVAQKNAATQASIAAQLRNSNVAYIEARDFRVLMSVQTLPPGAFCNATFKCAHVAVGRNHVALVRNFADRLEEK